MLFFSACQAQDGQDKSIVSAQAENKIEVIDFYTTHRCVTCLKIEDNTKKLLESSFKKEMDEGVITFQTVNVDEKANYEMAERYEAASTALFLNVVKDGKERHIDLTEFAFMKAFDEEEFASELKAKIGEQLKTL
jgi:thiol-disulfide isomerase/thioredoxin